MEFKILKKSKKSRARLGVIKTSHGVLRTPAFFPVATQGAVKTLDTEDINKIGFEGVLANTYHLMLRPGSKTIEKLGGLHKFMNFNGVIATDSGGFQVFSLGKGLAHKTGKIVTKTMPVLLSGTKKTFVKITDRGVYFKSHIDGSKHFLSPEKSIKIQQELGADIIFAFDECTSPLDNYEYIKKAMERTHKWALRCLKTHNKRNQWLFGIIQGGEYKDLRQESAKFMANQNFDGFGIGGSFGKSYGDSKKNMAQALDWTIPLLPENKPRHMLGIGYLDDFKACIKKGIDLFDCVYPTRMARHGAAITQEGVFSLMKTKFLTSGKPISASCTCSVCQNYSRGYISHLLRAKEITGMRLLTIHNLCFFKNYLESMRQEIKQGRL